MNWLRIRPRIRKTLQPEFWHARWRTGQIGFHQSKVDRHLKKHWPRLGLAPASRVFVPLCGKSLDLLWLLERGHSVVGVELSAVALESFCMEQGIPARRRTLDHFDVYENPGLELYRGDFFALTRQIIDGFSAAYDRAALISWAPALREAYVAHMTAMTSPGAQTLLVTMEYAQTQMSGPPFCVAAHEIESLYARHHAIEELSRDDVLADEPRLRARGVTELYEVCYRLTRL
jgi:thiopurine S-methyltransferase